MATSSISDREDGGHKGVRPRALRDSASGPLTGSRVVIPVGC